MSDQLVALPRSAQSARAIEPESTQNSTIIRETSLLICLSAFCHGTLLLRPAAVISIVSTTIATSPRHSEHNPTSNRLPSLTAPEKLVIVTSWRHLQHQTLDSNSFLLLLGMPAHNLAAGVVNLGMDSMGISFRGHAFFQFLASLEVRHILGRHLYLTARSGITPLTR